MREVQLRGASERCTLEAKLRDVKERRRWELKVSGAKEGDKCEMQLRVPIQRFQWKVHTTAERER